MKAFKKAGASGNSRVVNLLKNESNAKEIPDLWSSPWFHPVTSGFLCYFNYMALVTSCFIGVN